MARNPNPHPSTPFGSGYLPKAEYDARRLSLADTNRRLYEAREIAGEEEPPDSENGCTCPHAKRGIEAFWAMVHEQPCPVHNPELR